MNILENGAFFLATAPITGTTHAAQHAAAYDLLRSALRRMDLPTEPIRRTDAGRPYLDGVRGVDFNLSHTRTLAVLALCRDARVGVDAEPWERANARLSRLAERFFAPCELAYYKKGDPVRTFAEIFTRKEAFAKYSGEGLAAHLRKTDTMSPCFEKEHRVTFYKFDTEGHCITVCIADA